ncbi:unnamed protein product [Rotaria sordida]|uniref:Uncharacterized protein n=1 Tax=Rotaria sordida TaxID=392033 RepID=A0A815C9Z4_9BILA|nr:unnamed protein product [Rotaria sordida]CAF1361897.1 unnamed protein product [Rotaria sordida]CAF1402738.1 unnamed protein product [Rotaria sordida]CAF1607143.1 unnamed protein product [Rotaria sordida]CAF3792427.1 unnamed protein product [Rotaria sordida]
MPTEEFEKVKRNVGNLISPNGFFSTSRYLNIVLGFIAGCESTAEKIAVLFEITVDSQLDSVIFADIHTYSRMPEEREVLFSLGAVFIITHVKYNSDINVWKIYLKATDEGSKQKSEYLKLIQK